MTMEITNHNGMKRVLLRWRPPGNNSESRYAKSWKRISSTFVPPITARTSRQQCQQKEHGIQILIVNSKFVKIIAKKLFFFQK